MNENTNMPFTILTRQPVKNFFKHKENEIYKSTVFNLICFLCYWKIQHSPVQNSKHTELPSDALQKVCHQLPSSSK